MPLPVPAPHRQTRHRRTIDLHVYSRGDGLRKVDAALLDVKTRDVSRAREPIHDRLLRLVVDERLNIVEAGSHTRGMPHAGRCDAHGDADARLVGLNPAHKFRRGLRQRVGAVRGCTHLSEPEQVLPTAVIQAFAGEVIDTRAEHPGARKPFQIDRCPALRADREVVRAHYPRGFRQPDANNGADNPARDTSTTSASRVASEPSLPASSLQGPSP